MKHFFLGWGGWRRRTLVDPEALRGYSLLSSQGTLPPGPPTDKADVPAPLEGSSGPRSIFWKYIFWLWEQTSNLFEVCSSLEKPDNQSNHISLLENPCTCKRNPFVNVQRFNSWVSHGDIFCGSLLLYIKALWKLGTTVQLKNCLLPPSFLRCILYFGLC